MTSSFFLVQLIDKEEYNGIINLHQIVQDTFLLGETNVNSGPVYICGIEPTPEPSANPQRTVFSRDSSSLWLSVSIVPQPAFEENIVIFQELENWVMDSIYILRFVMNLNLKAKMFLHVEIIQEDQQDKKITIQKNFDPGCIYGSSFHKDYNRYDLVFPLIKKLLNYQPTNKFKSILYNYANSNIGKSGIIEYFYSFATFEGIFHNWTEENGYSELWGHAIATLEEQNSLHENLKAHFEQYFSQNHIEGLKHRQLRSFIDSTFPRDRKIRRTVRQKLKSYMDIRLTQEIRESDTIQNMWSNFSRIYSRRNEIGHSLENYTRTPGFIEDTETLLASIKILMDFEFSKFIEGESDWKFEERSIQLREIIIPMMPKKVLNHFLFNLDGENQTDVKLRSRMGVKPLEKIEFYAEMEYINLETRISYEKKIKMHYPPNSRQRLKDQQINQGVVTVYPNPYYWLFSNVGTVQYAFKTFESSSYTTEGGSIYYKFPTDKIIMVVKAESIEIPDNSILFSEDDF